MSRREEIAALFVEPAPHGVYQGLEGVDCWDEQRDARKYAGPWPVVAHPPCKRWGKYWHGGPSAKERRQLGDDGDCFAAAIRSVRLYGGVLEHPATSHAWRWFGLLRPPHTGGWVRCDSFDGWTCHVEQGHYGHRARKGTWLYAVGCDLPSLQWGPAQQSVRLDQGFHSAEERRAAQGHHVPHQRMSGRELLATPAPFRDLLIDLARSVYTREKQSA